MSRKITLLTTLEYLGVYKSGGDTFFGITLQVASDDAFNGPDEQDFFCPWKWKANDTWSTAFELWDLSPDKAAKTVTVNKPPTLDVPNDAVSKLKTTLEGLCKTFPLGWNSPVNSHEVESSADGESVRWPAQLAQLSRLPYPLPHHLGLACFLPTANGFVTGGILIAAPCFSVGGYTFALDPNAKLVAGTVVANPDVPSYDSATELVTIPYLVTQNNAPSVDFTVVLQTRAIRAADCKLAIRHSRSSDPILFNDPFVQLAVPEDRQWQSNLISESAKLFDVASLLIRALHLALAKEQPDQAVLTGLFSEPSTLRNAMCMAMLDSSGLGWENTPGNPDPATRVQQGPSLLSKLFTSWGYSAVPVATVPTAADFQNSVVEPLTGHKVTPATWQNWLSNQSLFKTSGIFDPMTAPAYTAGGSTVAAASLTSKLETFRAQVTRQEVLANYLLAQWDNLIPRSPTLERVKILTLDQLGLLPSPNADQPVARMDLHAQSLQGYLGSIWTAVLVSQVNLSTSPNTLDARTALRQALFDQLKIAVASVVTRAAASADLTNAINTLLFEGGKPDTCALRDDFYAVVPAPAALNGDVASSTTDTKVPEGIHLTVSSLAPHDTDSTGAFSSDADQKDPLRNMSGLCVYARRGPGADGTAGPWLLLNTAVPCLNGDKTLPLAGNTVVPVPLHTENGFRTATINFNSRPLMGRSPDMLLGRQSTPNPAAPGLVDFLAAPMVGLPPAQVPDLCFGELYQFVAGLVSNCGALPPGFGDPACPGKPTADLASTFDAAGLVKWADFYTNYGRVIHYKRTVQVRELGLRVGQKQKFELPSFPSAVHPRALEIAKSSADNSPNQQILLLTGYSVPNELKSLTSFTFSVHKPESDLRTWNGWIARPSTPANMSRRQSIWANLHFNNDGNLTAINNIRLDDPAVQKLLVRITPLDNATTCGLKGKPSTHNPCFTEVTWPALNQADLAEPETCPPISITITATPIKRNSFVSPAITLDANGPVVTIDATAGALARLELIPVLDSPARFIDRLVHPGRPNEPIALGVASTIFLETATDALPDPASLAKALSATLLPQTGTDGAILFKMNISDAQLSSFHNLYKVMLNLQPWQWDGRPPRIAFPGSVTVNVPDLTPIGDLVKLQAWVDEAYADRTTSVSSVMAQDNAHELRHTEDLTGQPGVLFYRYQVNAYSRYDKLLITTDDLDKIVVSTSTWGEALVPLRWKGTIPKPAIKAVLPLTSSLDTSERTASLLVIVQGPWFTVGGLGETLLAEMTEVVDEEGDGKPQIEAGPDPIRQQPGAITGPYKWPSSPDPLLLNATSPAKLPDTKFVEVPGPVGHTRDLNVSSGRLWINSSFVLPPVHAEGRDNADWEFARIRFRRGFSRNAVDNNFYTASDPSAAFWVQFLPNNDWFRSDKPSDSAMFANLRLVVQGTSASLLKTGSAAPIKFPPNPVSGVVTVPHLLVTEITIDQQTGNSDERYSGILALGADRIHWNLTGLPPISKLTFHVRVVEIETRDSLPKASSPINAELWEWLFPHEQNNDVKGRIVGISPLIAIAS